MNNLSWLLYLADLSSKLGPTSAALSLATGAAWVLYASYPYREEVPPFCKKALGISTYLCAFLGVLAFLVPSKTTIYLIAASETGEEVLKTDQARQVGEYLDQLLDDLVED